MPHPPLPTIELARGRTHWTAWLSTADAGTVEALAQCGFGSLAFDLQHGLIEAADARRGIAAAAALGAPSWVRVSVGGFDMAAQMLDAGAAGVICAMVNDPETARAFASAVKYPPLGRRSWGPIRALPLSGLSRNAYLGAANGRTRALGMIETEEGLRNLPDILHVEGLDGVFVGPNDLAVSVTGGESSEPSHPKAAAAIDRILGLCHDAGKPAAIFANTPQLAAGYAARGFELVTLGPDLAFVSHGARAMLQEATAG
jgi:4-hydroxy-2-oxoheptanedioate aldolase